MSDRTELQHTVYVVEARRRPRGAATWGKWRLMPEWYRRRRTAKSQRELELVKWSQMTDDEVEARVVPFDRRPSRRGV